MHYHYEFGAKRERGRAKRWVVVLMFVILIGVAAYGALLYLSPRFIAMPFTPKADANATAKKIESSEPKVDMLYIPQLNVDVPLAIGGGSDALAKGAWQQDRDKDVTDGGTVQICARAFSLGATPWQTRLGSPFYNLGRLKAGDQLVLDYKGNRYEYKIENTLSALPTQDADEPQLIVFTCDGSGKFTGAGVLAKPVGAAPAKSEQSNSLW